jgi:hypothetical protein
MTSGISGKPPVNIPNATPEPMAGPAAPKEPTASKSGEFRINEVPPGSAVLVQSVRAAIRSCSRNHACAGSAVSRGCHTMKYEKPLIS